MTAVRVPVFIGHSMAVVAESEDSLPLPVAKKLLEGTSGIEFLDRSREGVLITPLETVGSD